MRERNWPIILAALAVVFIPIVCPPFWVTLLNYTVLSSLVALGLVLVTGFGGTTSFGQASFVGIGAYATAVCTASFDLSPWIGLLAALTSTTAIAVVVGAGLLRMSGHYLPLGTLAWAVSLFYLFTVLPGLGGAAGLTGVPAISIGHLSFADGRNFFYLCAAFLAVSLLALHNLLDSQPGRVIRILPQGLILSTSLGIDAARYRIIIFTIAAVLSALSGWLYAHLQRFVNPTPFGIYASIEYLFMAIIGGISNIWGAVIGAVVISLIKQIIPAISATSSRIPENIDTIVFGLIALLILHRAKDGIWPYVARILPERVKGVRRVDRKQRLPPIERATIDGPILEISHLSKHFGALHAVDDVSFVVKPRQIVGLLGPNGAGKSTLFNLISGAAVPTSGMVFYCEENITIGDRRNLIGQGIARTFQHLKVAPTMTVIENIALGAYCRMPGSVVRSMLRLDRGTEALLMSEAAFQASRLGLEDLLHRNVSELSLGQQRLVEIARALASNPELLLLDEPAAGLRYAEKRKLAAILQQLRNEGLTIMLVEHDMDFVTSLADKIVVMNFGKIIAEGHPQIVLNSRDVMEAYLGVEVDDHAA